MTFLHLLKGLVPTKFLSTTHRLGLCSTLLGALLLLPSPAWCRSYEIAQHRDWASWIESSSRERVWAAAATISNSGKQRILFEVDFLPGACGVGTAFMTIPMFGYTDAPFTASGAIRVDRRAVIDTRFTIEPHPDGIRITIDETANEKLLQDAREGSIVRIKIQTENDKEPLFLRFSLSGFSMASTRAMGMCQRIELALLDQDDSSFFSDQPDPSTPDTNQKKLFPKSSPSAPSEPKTPHKQPSATPDDALTL